MSSETPESSAQESIGEKKTDETWKRRAQMEKEKLASSEEGPPKPPPASFLGLVQELGLRALVALGQVQNAVTGEIYFDLDEAKYAIDMLGVLEEKTRGNLDPSEKAVLSEVLHTLRLSFVELSRNPPRFGGPGGPEVSGKEPPAGESGARGPKIIF